MPENVSWFKWLPIALLTAAVSAGALSPHPAAHSPRLWVSISSAADSDGTRGAGGPRHAQLQESVDAFKATHGDLAVGEPPLAMPANPGIARPDAVVARMAAGLALRQLAVPGPPHPRYEKLLL
jgi:hypothetical protein